MMNKYYKIQKVKEKAEKEKSNFIFIYGGKSKGKSYQAKKELMINAYLQTGKRFVLLRRYSEEIDKSHTELYFRDFLANENLEELTGGKFNNIECIANKIYFTKIIDGKTEKKEHIGYAISLNREQNFSSILSEKDIGNIIFEEFQSRTTYLKNECDKLMFLYSTIDREQGTTKVWFMGNAISKACPYWDFFGILDLIKTQKASTIKSFEIDGKKILVEKTGVFNGSKTTIGTSASAISSGDWYAERQPRIKMKGHKRGFLYVNFDFNGLKFLGELNQTEKKDFYWFIRAVEFFKDTTKTYTVTNSMRKPSRLIGSDLYKMGGERFQEIISKTFIRDKIYYSTNEVGTDFNTACSFRIRG